jgi:hypothetical protein
MFKLKKFNRSPSEKVHKIDIEGKFANTAPESSKIENICFQLMGWYFLTTK